MTPIWKRVSRNPRYRVSDSGSVLGPRGFLKPCVSGAGYLYVSIRRPGVVAGGRVFIHKLVAEEFLGPCPVDQEVRHLDGTRTNNQIANLCYGTRAENIADRVRHHAAARAAA